MTQSKKPEFESTITLDDYVISDGDITINLSDYDMNSTTTYWAGDSITDVTITDTNDGTFTLDISDLTSDTVDIDWLTGKLNINPDEVERMCKEYPSLEKVWRNFKSVYDMCKQDYEGKKKAGEIEDDDEIPF